MKKGQSVFENRLRLWRTRRGKTYSTKLVSGRTSPKVQKNESGAKSEAASHRSLPSELGLPPLGWRVLPFSHAAYAASSIAPGTRNGCRADHRGANQREKCDIVPCRCNRAVRSPGTARWLRPPVGREHDPHRAAGHLDAKQLAGPARNHQVLAAE